MIKSIGYSQQEIIRDALLLHGEGKDPEVDITYSTGGFYKNGILKQPK